MEKIPRADGGRTMSKLLISLREEISKWIMRTKNAGVIMRIPLLGVTAVSTMITALRGTFLERYTLAIVVGFGVAALVFVWAYDRFQVMNMQNRWNADRADNYYGPTGAIDQLAAAEREAVLAQSIKNDWDMEKTREEMKKAAERAISEYRNGVDMERFQK